MKRRLIFLAILFLVSGSILIRTGCSPRQSDQEAIKKTLAEFNLAYESKDVDRWISFFSKEVADRNTNAKGGVEAWKKGLKEKYFSPWKTITISSEAKSIDRTGYNYVLTEEITISGTDLSDQNHIIKNDIKRVLAFTKEHGKWKIADLREISLPSVYENLSSQYPEIGRPGLAYAAHISLTFVSVIDTRTNQVIGIIPSGNGPVWTELAPDRKRGYVANFNSNDVTVFDLGTNQKISTVSVGEHPTNITVIPDGQTALISHQSKDGIWVMNTQTNQIEKKLPEGTGPFYLFKKGKLVYQVEIFRPFVFVIDPKSQSIIKRIEVGGRPMSLAFTPDWRFAYVPNYDLNELEKIDTQTDSVVSRISNVNDPRGIAITPDGRFAYVTNVVSNKVTVLNLRDDSIIKTISVDGMPTWVEVTPDGKYAYVTNQARSTISVIDTKTNQVVQTIEVAESPITIRIDKG
jgi:YVTN family beta-propeller protein